MMKLFLPSEKNIAPRCGDKPTDVQPLSEGSPIFNMLRMLSKTGRKNFHEKSAWEVCLCALILRLEPTCKAQRIYESLPYDDLPMDEADFLNSFAHLGYFCRKTEATLKTIDARLLPALFISEGGSPYLLLGRSDDGALQIYDPVSKKVTQSVSRKDKYGAIWFFLKYDENRTSISKFMRMGSGYSWFRALLGRFKGTFAQVMTAGLILNVIALATPLYIMIVYDRVIAASAIETLPMLALGAFIAIIFEWSLRDIRSAGLSWLAGRLDNVVGNKIFAHLIGLSPNLIEKASVAAQIARIKTFEAVRDFFSGAAFLSLLEAPFVFLSIAAVFMIAGPLVFVPVSMIFGYIALFWFVRKHVKTSIRLAAKASSVRQQFTIETFEKLSAIRGHGLGRKWQEKFRHLSGREMMSHFNLSWLGMVAETCAHTLTVIAAIATVGFGVHMIWEGAMSTGALVATMILVWRILTPFYSMCTMVPRLEQLRNSIIQVNDLMDIDTEAEEARSFSRLAKITGDISFHNVCFSYGDDGDAVFSNLSFEARRGDFVTVTGGNGTGKATVLKLIQSLHKSTKGTVRIDGFDIRQLDAPDLRRQISYVPKEPKFFSGSLIDNMRLSNPMASRDDVIQALDMVDAWGDIQNMPEGLDSLIGSCGTTVLTSNMQARLSLARAYLNPANILLIDELPNALLSGKAGDNLNAYIADSKGKRTIILCTYREDFIALSDKTISLRGLSSPVVQNSKKINQGQDHLTPVLGSAL